MADKTILVKERRSWKEALSQRLSIKYIKWAQDAKIDLCDMSGARPCKGRTIGSAKQTLKCTTLFVPGSETGSSLQFA